MRRLLGPLEVPAARAFRALFIDLSAFISQVSDWVPSPNRIVEIGTGDGLLAQDLAGRFPSAELTGIDVAEEPGRLFRGDGRVVFRSVDASDLAREQPGAFDLVVICDVLHHVAPEDRAELLVAAQQLAGPGGAIVIKEWDDRDDWLCRFVHFVETRVSGAYTRYDTAAGWLELIGGVFGEQAVQDQARIGRRPHNVAYLVRS